MNVIESNIDILNQLCEEHKVEKMYLFGSALNGSFSENSDLDFLVGFEPMDLAEYFQNYIDFKEDLERLFQKEIDLVEEQSLKNPILIKSINQSKELIYG